jgi:hypothetical protein
MWLKKIGVKGRMRTLGSLTTFGAESLESWMKTSTTIDASIVSGMDSPAARSLILAGG